MNTWMFETCSYCYVCSVLFVLLCTFRSFLIVMRVLFCVIVCFVYCLCVNVYWKTATDISGRFSTTLTEGFPCFFLSCKANARV
jgi:hypothetical protein